MIVNLQEIRQDIQSEVEKLLDFVTGKEAQSATVDHDGKGVPMVLETPAEHQIRLGKGKKRGRKKEAVVTSVYTIASAPCTPLQHPFPQPSFARSSIPRPHLFTYSFSRALNCSPEPARATIGRVGDSNLDEPYP
jgi:hypothetical protein